MNTETIKLHTEARRRGLRLAARGADLLVIPARKLDAEFAARLKERKPELLAMLATIPPDDLPLDPIEPTPSAHDRERALFSMLRQGADQPGPLCEWLVRREWQYFDGTGAGWDCAAHAYAATRDCLCWQQGRSEPEVLQTLASDALSRSEETPQ